jgi:hypothetical protein
MTELSLDRTRRPGSAACVGHSPKKKISSKMLSGWNLIDDFRRRLSSVQAASASTSEASPARAGGPERKLLVGDYFRLFLFGLLNPVVESMRGLCAASHIKRVGRDVCSRPVSLGSFSEAQSVFDPNLLEGVFQELVAEACPGEASWGDPRLAPFAGLLKAVDGTLLPALPRMLWALWQDDDHRAAKLHLKFDLLHQAPCELELTAGKSCERKALRAMLKKGEIDVGDRYYGLDYGFFGELREAGVSFVIRIRNNPRLTVVGELPLTGADRAAGVTWQGMVRLGAEGRWQGAPVRLVTVEVDGHTLQIVTDLDIEAELIALIYRYRWQVELFFKWLKCILGCRHLLAESPEGVRIQIYCALIAALMLQALTGKRPSKREMELIRFYMAGSMEVDELMALLARERERLERLEKSAQERKKNWL